MDSIYSDEDIPTRKIIVETSEIELPEVKIVLDEMEDDN